MNNEITCAQATLQPEIFKICISKKVVLICSKVEGGRGGRAVEPAGRHNFYI